MLEEYHRESLADIRRDADLSGVLMVEAFFDRMTERLCDAGEIDTADRAFFEFGSDSNRMRIDGYAGDPRDSDGVLSLIICDFWDTDDVRTFSKSEAPALLNPLIRFLKKARDPKFRDSLNEVNPAFQLSDLIIELWDKIEKIKLILVSNREYTGRDDAVKLTQVKDVPVVWSVWDLARFEKFERAGQARAEMVIDFEGEFDGALPALKASQHESALESYLAIIPGVQLAAVYDRWGARLLEANVRSFLQAKGKTNKGIQRTIRDEPELFFPYNNGLSVTADEVECVQTDSGMAIKSVTNLQIVNGGQTTGSVHAALKSAKDRLPEVFVQMKLTVVPPERSEDVVPRISEFANTQNKVNAADFFSNHPFHVRIEQFSRSVIFAPKEGERHDTKWFYERSRGQYLNERSRLDGKKRKNFEVEYPKPQLFSKTDLAKFEHSANGLPFVVSRGAQKNFSEFAKKIGEDWKKRESFYDELWFRRLIAKAIIFRRLETLIPRQEWYEGGYRANIATYAMAKVFHDSRVLKAQIDLDRVWKAQVVGPVLEAALLAAAQSANVVITSPPAGVKNFSEWAKKQACWNALEGRSVGYGGDFKTCLISGEKFNQAKTDGQANDAIVQDIVTQTKVLEIGGSFWRELLAWGREKKALNDYESSVLRTCAAIPARVPDEQQSKIAMATLEKCRRLGFSG